MVVSFRCVLFVVAVCFEGKQLFCYFVVGCSVVGMFVIYLVFCYGLFYCCFCLFSLLICYVLCAGIGFVLVSLTLCVFGALISYLVVGVLCLCMGSRFVCVIMV